jgi:putative transposase
VVEYRHRAPAVTDLKYHVIWVTKYRYKIVRGDIAERARDLLRQICVAREVTIIRGAVSPDPIHMLVAAPPQLSPSKLVQVMKGRSSRLLQQEFPALRKRYWTTFVGTGLLLRERRRGGRNNDPRVYRAPTVGRGHRWVHGHRADRALSRRGSRASSGGFSRDPTFSR